MAAGKRPLAIVPEERFEAFREDRPAPLAVMVETLMAAGKRPLAIVPNARLEAFVFERVFPDPINWAPRIFPEDTNEPVFITLNTFKTSNVKNPEISPVTRRFPVKVPSPAIILAHMTFPFVDRTFEAMITLDTQGPEPDPDPPAMTNVGAPFAMLSHMTLSIFD